MCASSADADLRARRVCLAWPPPRCFNASSLFPFILLFSDFGQLAAAMWSYKARDAVAASIHGVWGGYWIVYGLP